MSAGPVRAEAIVCTHLFERLDEMAEAVASLQRQSAHLEQVIVVVDGDTALLEAVAAKISNVTLLCTGSRTGLARARNLGIEAARAEAILFLDDDAIAEHRWAERLLNALEETSALGASGASLPVWGRRQPAWLPDAYLWTVGCSYAGMPQVPTDVRNVYGGCAGIRRVVFQEVGGFNESLGHAPGEIGGGEEAELCLRASMRWPQARFRFEPSAVIHHRVPSSRLQMRYVLSRAFAEGRMKARVSRLRGSALGPERQFALALPGATARALTRPFKGDFSGAAEALGLVVLSLAVVAGLVVGRLRASEPAA